MPPRPPETTRRRIRWPRRGAARAGPPRLHALDAAQPLPREPFVALVPGTEAVLMPVELPSRLRGAAREAVAGRQLRDRLGAEGDALDMRPARFDGRDSDWDALLVADRAAADGWRAAVAPAGPRCRAILPDYLALPTAPGVWTVAITEGAPARLRLGPHDGFAAEPELAALALTRALDARPHPDAVLWLGPAEPALEAVLAQQPELAVVTDPQALPDGVPAPQVLGHGETALDLGADLHARAARMQARLGAARLPLALAAAGIAAWAVAIELETRETRERTAGLRAEIRAAVERDFVPEGPILDIRNQVSRALERRRAAAGGGGESATPMGLLYDASTALSDTDATLTGLAMQRGGEITLDLTVADFGALDAAADALRGAGLSVRPGRSSAAESGNGGVTGTLIVEMRS